MNTDTMVDYVCAREPWAKREFKLGRVHLPVVQPPPRARALRAYELDRTFDPDAVGHACPA